MKTMQPEFDFTGAQLRDQGMAAAVASAETEAPGWAEQAYSFLERFIRSRKGEFMVEQVRERAKGVIPDPPSNRAWGSLIRKAKSEGLIKRVGFRSVTNPKAHCAPCSVWEIVV